MAYIIRLAGFQSHKAKAQGYIVAYLWKGERHRDLSRVFSSTESVAAREHLAAFRNDGWRAWFEEL
jgi:hypothetical protein